MQSPRFTLNVLLCLLTLVSGSQALADDLDIIVAPSTPTQRGQAYDRLTKLPFDSVAVKLLTLIGLHLTPGGLINVDPDHPWLEPGRSEADRINLTLTHLWNFYLHNQKSERDHLNEMLTLLENQSIGSIRSLVADDIKSKLHNGLEENDVSLPPLTEVVPRLEKIARNRSESDDIRLNVLEILLEQSDPNYYLDEAMDRCDAEPDASRRSEKFRFTILEHAKREKLTAENSTKCLKYGFKLLKSINDGRGGGYFLAMDLGRMAGVSPTMAGGEPLCPDTHKANYNDAQGTRDIYFQETVDNALKWWADGSVSR